MGEHGGRDVQVVDMPLGAAEEIVDQRHRLGQRDRRELDAIDHVADRDRCSARWCGSGRRRGPRR
jgi:hypothetical protein